MKIIKTIPLYSGELIILQNKTLKNVQEKYKTESLHTFDAVSFSIYTKKGYSKYIMAFSAHCTHEIIAHEVTHIVNLIFKDSKIKLDEYNDEPQAYLAGWVAKQCYKHLHLKTVQ